MKNISRLLTIYFLIIFLFSCSKKTIPTSNVNRNNENTVANSNTTTEKKSTPVKVKAPVPSVIVVNDNAAQKTVDGRFYYDLNGKRYWRNNKDGKYYLFNKSMYNNPDFKGLP